MTRKERRRLGRESQKNNKVYNMTTHQLSELDKKVRQDEVSITKKVFMSVMVNSLHANYGFGKKRIERVINDMYGQLIAVSEGVIQPHEVLDMAMKLKIDKVFEG